MVSIQWQLKPLAELSSETLYQILKLRQDVFVIEQHCSEPDIDDLDHKALHLIGHQSNKLVAYARLFAPGNYYAGYTSFGRVAVPATARGLNLGRGLVHQALAALQSRWPESPIKISAQYYLVDFYQSFGFKSVGEAYNEAGILHIAMLYSSPIAKG